LLTAMKNSRHKIIVFLFAVLSLVVIMGASMYLIEGQANGFTSIPRGMYWAIVTVTTVGYGDISPHTVIGQIIASMLMIAGYGIIAVPTGIVTAELTHVGKPHPLNTRTCPSCLIEGHERDAHFCMQCGASLEGEDPSSAETAQS
jgi:voltage-gated potassium channel